MRRNIFYSKNVETLEQVIQRICGYSIIGKVQGQVWWAFGHPDLEEGVPAHRVVELQSFFLTQTIL